LYRVAGLKQENSDDETANSFKNPGIGREANVFETVAVDVIENASNTAAKAAFDGNAKLTAKSGTVDVLIDKR